MKKLISVIIVLSVIMSTGVCFADYSDVSSDDACYKAAVTAVRDYMLYLVCWDVLSACGLEV